MVRSMFSGVAGMKAHQTKMDTIGNNISNVNTYGFKSSRVTFRDIYYQSMRNASQGTGNKGGTNPSQIGYGSSVGSIDVNQTQSSMQNTGNPLDTAITGEGFFQVQDADGNTFYTKAGMLDVDSFGNLVDVNGNFVLGVSGNPIGKPAGSGRIQIAVPPVGASTASYTEKINEIEFSIKSSKQTTDANVTFTFTPATDLPIGQKAEALITSSGINIRLNSAEKFGSIGDLETAVNDAIKAANGGAEHPGGTFSISMDPATKFKDLTGAEICGANFGIKKGTVPVPAEWEKLFKTSVGDAFMPTISIPAYTITQNMAPATNPPTVPPPAASYDFQVVVGGNTYTGTLTKEQMKSSTDLLLKNTAPGANANDYITLSCPSESALLTALDKETAGPPVVPPDGILDANELAYAPITKDITQSTSSNELGIGGTPFKLKGGTKGGPQTIEDLTSIAIGSDGVIIGNHSTHGILELGRIDLATFANPKGLIQSGSTYFAESANSGTANTSKAGEGGTGALAGGSLEMSNVDLSSEFADMITTQRGFQANSRMITVSDTMLEELINLKR